MPERLFQEWQAFWQIEPFGGEWRQTSRICMVLQNLMRDPKKKAATEDDFMPTKPRPMAQPDKVRSGLLSWLMPRVKRQPD